MNIKQRRILVGVVVYMMVLVGFGAMAFVSLLLFSGGEW